MTIAEPQKRVQLDAEELAGHRFPYQEDLSLVEDVDLLAATPGEDINWLEDVELLEEDGVPAVFDRYSNSFLKIYFPIPEGARTRSPARCWSSTCSRATPTASSSRRSTASSPSPSSAPGSRARKTVGHRLAAARARGLGAAGSLMDGSGMLRSQARACAAAAITSY